MTAEPSRFLLQVMMHAQVSSWQDIEAAYEEELGRKGSDILQLAAEVEALKAALHEETEHSRLKVEQERSRLEFEIANNQLVQPSLGETGPNNIKDDLMGEIQSYEEKLKEKDLIIEKLSQTNHLNLQLVQQIQDMNKMVYNANDEEPFGHVGEERIRHDSFDVPKSFEPETLREFVQIEEVQKLKEHIGSLVQAKTNSLKAKNNSSDLPTNVQKILDDKNNMIMKMKEEINAMKMTTKDLIDEDDESSVNSEPDKRSTLEVQVRYVLFRILG